MGQIEVAPLFRAQTLEEVLRIAPSLSLKTQGLLDQPSAPLAVATRWLQQKLS